MYRELAEADWAFADAELDPLHSIHPYPAKFIGEIPRRLIAAFTQPGDLVLDPFVGGGTTAVEALRAGRRFHGIDANPLAVQLTRVKTGPFTHADREAIEVLTARCTAVLTDQSDPSWLPDIPNCDKWYDPEVFAALGRVRDRVMDVTLSNARGLALLTFANTAARASYQESETRYVAKRRHVDLRQVVARFNRDVTRSAEILLGTGWPAGLSEVHEGDARDLELYPETAAAVVTSPPYPNAFDYHLYHRFRLFWLGPGPIALRRMEIGSHLKHQTDATPSDTYLDDMQQVLANSYASLTPGGWAAFVVGDGIYGGRLFSTADELSEVARSVGYDVYPAVTRALPVDRRSVTIAGRRLQHEQVLILQKPVEPVVYSVSAPAYSLHPYERVLRGHELRGLGATVVSGADGSATMIATASPSRSGELRQLAFSRSLVDEDGTEVPTASALLEGASTGRRKNSSYLTHGLHRYKGKFYPQLAKSLINASGVSGGRILDPFGGSGTVALEATLAGHDAISIDCNPVAHATARAKTDVLHVEPRALRSFLKEFDSLRDWRATHAPLHRTAFAGEVMEELLSWFPIPVLNKLDNALRLARAAEDPRLVNIGEVLVSDVIREVSQQEPKDLRIRRRAVPIEDAPVFELLADRAHALLAKFEHYADTARDALPSPGLADVILGDSTDPNAYPAERADALVSSPPYAAALPYIDTDRLSIATVFGVGARDRRPLEATMVGSREIGATELRRHESLIDAGHERGSLPQSTISWLQEYLHAVRADAHAGFRRRQAPAVLARYFFDMHSVLRNSLKRLNAGAHVWLVLGDSKSTIAGRQWVVPTVREVLAIADNLGYMYIERIPITVTREDRLHSRHAITENDVLHLQVPYSHP